MHVDLKQLFLALQEQLDVDLQTNRAVHTHAPTKGDSSEIDWVAMLSSHLPARYQVSRAFVVDADGNRSDQIDVVIYDRQYCPLLFNRNGHYYIPAESVYAVFEVKQTLNRQHLMYAGDKAASVRRLRRTSAPIPHAGGTYEPRELFTIIAGILCSTSDWKAAFGRPFVQTLHGLTTEQQLDLGCVLGHGAFDARYGEAGEAQLSTSTRDTALVHFFLHLLQQLQALGTVPAIDLTEYSRVLEQ